MYKTKTIMYDVVYR